MGSNERFFSGRARGADVRDAKNTRAEPEVAKHRSRKDTRKWCRGRVGVEHQPRWIFDERRHLHSKTAVLECGKCRKQLDTCWRGGKNCRCGLQHY